MIGWARGVTGDYLWSVVNIVEIQNNFRDSPLAGLRGT